MSARTHLFVTGAYRSGTTLVEKLCQMHPSIAVASQPFPLLYPEAKQRFLTANGWRDRYPLGDLFGEARYRPEDLARFLDEMVLTAEELRSLVEAMRDYSGWWTPEVAEQLDDLGGGTFLQIRHRMHEVLARRFGRGDAAAVGSKEILCEEYVGYLLDRGERVVVVLRDPRAVIASLVSGEGERYGGKTRPLLFHVRNWRKSVAVALGFDEHPSFTALRYEDVVAEPARAVAQVARLLDLPESDGDLLAEGVRDQRGEPWLGNSSFGARPGVSAASLDAYHTALAPETVRAVEAACRPELLALGYPCAEGAEVGEVLGSFREPHPVDHPAFAGDDSLEPARAAAVEAQRVALLGRADLDDREAERWFVHSGAYRRLRQALLATG